ncbi:MAG: glycosyltransferase family 39 protein [Chloroflexi bacterium]|nr:glycosyltransferase family 39 protein [Chloroflexota bacterium]
MDSSSPLKPPMLLSRFLWVCVAAGLVVYLAFTLWLCTASLRYPYELDYGEGDVLWFAYSFAHGLPVYKGLTGMPYASSNYPPVAMVMAAALMPILGDGYLGGRLLNLASVILVSFLIYRVVRVESSVQSPETRHSIAAGVLAALLFIGSPYVYDWAPLFRVDLIGLAFTFGGLYAVWSWERHVKEEGGMMKVASRELHGRPRDPADPAGSKIPRSHAGSKIPRSHAGPWRGLCEDESKPNVVGFSSSFRLPPSSLVVALVLFLLALFTKQSLLAAPAAAIFAIAHYSKRTALAFGVVLLGVGGGIYLLIDHFTAGGFTLGIIASNASTFLPGQLADLVMNFALTFPILLLLAFWEWIQRVRTGRWGILEVYLLTAIAVCVLAGRIGAWENYFLEAVAAVSVMAGLAVHRFAALSRRSPLAARFMAFGLPILLLAQLALMKSDPRIAADMMAKDYQANQQLAALLRRTTGNIISEDMGALITSGKPVVYYTYQYSMLARSGQWDQSWELDGLRQGAFPLVILERGTREDVDHYRRFTREFLSSLDRYYGQVAVIGKYIVYAPAPLDHLQTADFGDDIRLVGWSARSDKSDANKLKITIVWQAERAMTVQYKAFLHLEDSAGAVIDQDDHEPMWGIYPTTRWAPGEMVRDVYTLKALPEHLDSYTLHVGWYAVDTGDRLPVINSPDDSVVLAPSPQATQR